MPLIVAEDDAAQPVPVQQKSQTKTITIRLPLTLAIITVLMVEVSGNVYALPSGSVVESLHYRRSEVVQMNGRDTLRIRDRIIPLVHLAEFFGVVEP